MFDNFSGRHSEAAQRNGAQIVIGLMNIMPPAAMRTMETLFRGMLDGSAAFPKIHLRLFTLQNGPSEGPSDPLYEGLDDLWDSPDSERPLDALIVTGTEARSRLMIDEPCWPALQKICDWAAQNTISTIWSCFSAHAAVLHMDNIHRQPLSEKLTGIFECQKVSCHPLLKDMPDRWAVPHSRYNNLNAAELAASGYEILSRSPSAGADSFVKQHQNSLFLFMQGHPEYGPERLFAEYYRDLKRFSLRQNAVHPELPENYLDQASMEVIMALQKSRQSLPDALWSAEFVDAVAACLHLDWRAPAQQLFTSWLCYIADRKSALSDAQMDAQFAPADFRDLRPSETLEYISPA